MKKSQRVTNPKFRVVVSLEGRDVLSGRGTQRAKTELLFPSSSLFFLHQSPPLELYLVSLFLSHPHAIINQQGLSTVSLKPNSSISITLLWLKPPSSHWDCCDSSLPGLSRLYNASSTTKPRDLFKILSQIMSFKFSKGFVPFTLRMKPNLYRGLQGSLQSVLCSPLWPHLLPPTRFQPAWFSTFQNLPGWFPPKTFSQECLLLGSRFCWLHLSIQASNLNINVTFSTRLPLTNPSKIAPLLPSITPASLILYGTFHYMLI